MDTSHKILIDVEKEDKTIGYFFKSEDGKKIEAVLAGKHIVRLSKILCMDE